MAYTIDKATYDKARTYAPGHGHGHLVARNPDRYVAPRPAPPTSIVIHTTNNRRKNTPFASEATFLYETPSVSSHYMIGKSPQAGIVQFLDDSIEAWHAGAARLGYRNPDSIGIENHVSVGEAPTIWQHDALTWLVQGLMARWAIPHSSVQTHRAVALPSGRKTDPEGWSDRDFYAWVRSLVPVPFAPPALPTSAYTADSPLIGVGHATLQQATAYVLAQPHPNYSDSDIADVILPAYWSTCQAVGVDPVLAVAQMCHEGAMVSYWGARPHRNPAGIGVDGTHSDTMPDELAGWAYNTQRQRWEMGCSFPTWKEDAIPAHVGRLLCYALGFGTGTPRQMVLIAKAMRYRPFPVGCRGSAPTLKQLGKIHNPKGATGCGWASPGEQYGEQIAAVANAIVGHS